MPLLHRSDRVFAGAHAAEEVGGVGRVRVAMKRTDVQRIVAVFRHDLKEFRVARLDFAAVDVDPALVADEPAPLFVRVPGVAEVHDQAGIVGHGHLPRDPRVGHSRVGEDAFSFEIKRFFKDFGDPPARNVEVVHAPVRDEAGAVVLDHVEAEPLDTARVKRVERRRARPHVPVEPFRRVARRNGRDGRAAGGRDLDFLHLAEVAVSGEERRLAEFRVTALLGADLENRPVLAHEFLEFHPLTDPAGKRLFAVEVFARLDDPAVQAPVPVVADRAPDRVNVVAQENVAEIPVEFAPFVLARLDPVGVHRLDQPAARLASILPGLGDRHDLVVRQRTHGPNRVRTAVSDSEHRDGDPVVRTHLPVFPENRSRNHQRRNRRSGDGL